MKARIVPGQDFPMSSKMTTKSTKLQLWFINCLDNTSCHLLVRFVWMLRIHRHNYRYVNLEVGIYITKSCFHIKKSNLLKINTTDR